MKKPLDILRVAVQTTGVGVGRRGCEQSSGIRFVSHVYKQMSCAGVKEAIGWGTRGQERPQEELCALKAL